MRTYRLWIALLLAFVAWGASARNNPNERKANKSAKAQYRDVCANSESQIDQQINNVRARLLGGGDCWWDFSDGRYIVPKVDVTTGQAEVSSLYAGSVWLGGIDPGGNLKLACQDYRAGANNEFWPGPLTALGITEQFTCENWDRHFYVTGEDIRKHLSNLSKGNLNPNDIPRNVKGWPAKGNPYFVDVWGFDLPATNQPLAGFLDKDDSQDYDPLKGDYPSIEIRGCPLDRYPDEMVFWMYNDHGGGQPHGNTNGRAIQMEVQVQAFGYQTVDALNDMTFQRYRLINRATERIDSTFFAMWADPDLGCHLDDYIGCDTAKDLMYVYNQDPTDGQPGATCPGGTAATYGNKVPVLGIDYFRGPLDSNGLELPMSSFVYYNNPSFGNPIDATTDPDQPQQFYNYLTGTWKDGTPFTYGGSGYGPGTPIDYVFTETPSNTTGWSMCQVVPTLPFGDRRTLQASGPFTLLPGADNELIIGIPWVADVDYPCPDMERLFRADKLAQGLFDNCFDLLEGPNAPDADWVEMDREIIVVLTNNPDTAVNNNAKEQYYELDFLAPDTVIQSADPAVRYSAFYRFEGYKIYQLINPNVSAADYENTDVSKLVYQVDVRNGVAGKIYNWEEINNPNSGNSYYIPELKVESTNTGIRHSFSVKEDRFAQGNDKRLVNHKKYYYTVVAYGYNNFQLFDPVAQPAATGQPIPYLTGRLNVKVKTVIPRPIVDVALNSAYGDGVQITRLEGAGVGGNFIEIDDATRENILSNSFDSTLTYKSGRGPLTVTIFNPFEVKDGDYELEMVDDNLTDNTLKIDARWNLRKLPDGQIIASENTIEKLNEQIIPEFGFSVAIAQGYEPGAQANVSNGAIGAEIEYKDPDQPWLTGYADQAGGPLNFVKTGSQLEEDFLFDPNQSLSMMGDGYFVPYPLCDWRNAHPDFLITPAWTDKNSFNGSALGNADARKKLLAQLPNVDIVFTSDKSKWSRCVIIEGASYAYTSTSPTEYAKFPGFNTESPVPPGKVRANFDVRYSLSVGKDDSNGDGFPDPDGAVEPDLLVNPNGSTVVNTKAGQPLYGMGWFPGYAIDVETGRRLNVFFAENSCFSKTADPTYTGRDMMWNPNGAVLREGVDPTDVSEYYDLQFGGQHWVYVTNTSYDECAFLRWKFSPELSTSATAKLVAIDHVSWAGMLNINNFFPLRSYKDGLIPRNADAIVKLRVDNPYQTWFNDNNANMKTGHPRYGFKVEGRGRTDLSGTQIENALDSVKVIPNPYYGFSQYETSQFTQTVKISNLPGKCQVTIYSLDGKFIRQYNRNEQYEIYNQIAPDIEWDMKNSKGIPVASGVYLIHFSAPDMGERTVKWFGIARQFDPSKL